MIPIIPGSHCYWVVGPPKRLHYMDDSCTYYGHPTFENARWCPALDKGFVEAALFCGEVSICKSGPKTNTNIQCRDSPKGEACFKPTSVQRSPEEVYCEGSKLERCLGQTAGP